MQQTKRISEYNNLIAEIGKEKIESGSASIADEAYLLDKLSRVAKISLQ